MYKRQTALEKQKKALQGNVKLLKAVEKVKPDLEAIQPEKTLTGAVKGVTVEQMCIRDRQIEGDGKAKRCTITDELDELREQQDTDFTIMSPISYFDLRRCGKNARYLYALVIDLDGVGMPQLRDTLHQICLLYTSRCV